MRTSSLKSRQKRTNKFVSVQVNPTANSIQGQRSQDKEMTKPNLQLQLNQNLAGIIETKSEPHQEQPLANKKHFQRSYIIHNIVKVLAFHGRFAHDTKLEYGSVILVNTTDPIFETTPSPPILSFENLFKTKAPPPGNA